MVQEAFKTRPSGLEWVPFPDKSGQVADRPALTLVVMSPSQGHGDPATLKLIDQIIREHGQSGRTFKSALIFAVAENDDALRDEARKLLAWEDIQDDDETVKRLDEGQRRRYSTMESNGRPATSRRLFGERTNTWCSWVGTTRFKNSTSG